MTRVELSVNEYRKTIQLAKTLSLEIDRLVKAEEWNDIEALIAERNQALEKAFVPTLPETLHKEARDILALAKQQDKNLLTEAKQRKNSAGAELVKLKHGKKSVQSYLSGE